ncbi:BMP family ABC transporter substrate-binding protein [Hazenella sp. IB182357]|uniref:BMP family ABC transporter substrate-binding protein n=1 Tax=Polycladospora coralii TaxID=2771432 RepID=A0A926N7Y4_9BACL|nr:BMP family ABC transporter substrate-binding protein [Polycladospora coralii]MBD1373646.1 BMP family ABC transporter substrate-binding protein [Polycladospora coralii]MBS7530827.1 BMP family ABC transporter substrate-binding protein [Polycladospora coralii]
MKKRTWLAMILAAMLILAVGCGQGNDQAANESGFKVGMVTDTGGLNDESFNQTTWDGLERAKDELGADIKALESKQDSDYVPNLTKFAREGRNLTWAVGFKHEKAVPEVAQQFPDVQFGIVDSNLGGNIPANVTAVTFKEEEGSFLVGAAAGLTTKTNKVGFIGGINSELIEKFEAGFIAGVKAVNPKAEVISAYAGSFSDVTKGRTLSAGMYNQGADIIYHAAGGVGKGLFDEVKTREAGKFWAIGVDMDQSRLAPEHTLTSMVKKVDVAVFDITKSLKDKDLKSGEHHVFGLQDDAVGLAENTKNINPDVLTKVNEYKEKIISGDIVVPTKVADVK